MSTKKKTAKAACLAAFLLLSGCGKAGSAAEQGEKITEIWQQKAGFSAKVQIICEDEQAIGDYRVNYVYAPQDADVMTLEAPESLAGITLRTAGEGDTLIVQYEDAEFADGIPVRRGASAADGVAALLALLRQEEPAEIWEEKIDGVKMLAARYETEDEDGRLMRQVWMTQDGLDPVCAEVYSGDKRVLQMLFSEVRKSE